LRDRAVLADDAGSGDRRREGTEREDRMGQGGLPGLSHVDHGALTVPDLDAAVEHLRRHGVRVMAGPTRLTEGPCAGLRFIYFLDPWGNQLELVEYDRLAFMGTSPVPIFGVG